MKSKSIREAAPWIAIALFILAILGAQAQISVEVGVGTNSYKEPGSYSANMMNLQGGLSHDWLDGYVTTRAKAYYGELESDHNECFYDVKYYGAGVDMMTSVNRVFQQTSNYFVIKPFIGAGYANYNKQGVLSLELGTQFNARVANNLWVNLEFVRSGLTGLDQTMYGADISSRETDAINDRVVVGLKWTIPKSKRNMPARFDVGWDLEKEMALKKNEEDPCIECNPDIDVIIEKYAIPRSHIIFAEGSCDPLNVDEIITILDFLEDYPDKKIEVHGYHCTNQGSKERNLELSQCRIDEVIAYLLDAGISSDRLIPVPHGYKDSLKRFSGKKQAAQRRVSFTVLN